MSRYIKFDDAVKIMACEMYAEAQSQGYDVDDIEDFMPEAKAWITDAPSIDIVRCGECKWFDSKGHCMRLTAEYGTYEDVRTDDFCSYGQKGDENVETD